MVALATASGVTSCENFTGELCCERKYVFPPTIFHRCARRQYHKNQVEIVWLEEQVFAVHARVLAPKRQRDGLLVYSVAPRSDDFAAARKILRNLC